VRFPRLAIAGALFAAVTTAAVVSVAPTATSAQQPDHHPSNLAHVGTAGQVIVVTADSWTTTQATVRAYERDGSGGWAEVVAATPARIGWSGLTPAAKRRQGTGKTPAGTFAIVDSFGRSPDPGTRMPYRRVDRDDAWTYNPERPATYNMLQTAPVEWDGYGRYVEKLWSYGTQYNYVTVLDYNLPPGPITTGADGIRRAARTANTKAGGGIFLHVTNGKSTAGCVAIPQDTMRQVMQWLDPGRKPVIVIGPASVITSM